MVGLRYLLLKELMRRIWLLAPILPAVIYFTQDAMAFPFLVQGYLGMIRLDTTKSPRNVGNTPTALFPCQTSSVTGKDVGATKKRRKVAAFVQLIGMVPRVPLAEQRTGRLMTPFICCRTQLNCITGAFATVKPRRCFSDSLHLET